jgi:hypothetical protein
VKNVGKPFLKHVAALSRASVYASVARNATIASMQFRAVSTGAEAKTVN